MKSIFLGNRIECLQVLQEFSNVMLVITSKGSRVDKFYQINKKKKLINKKNINEINNIIKYSNVRLILSAGYPKIIPKNYIPKDKIIINSHPSLLPKYKGLRPIKDAIKNNEDLIGVSTHFLNENLDSGKIINNSKIFIKDKMNLIQIHKIIFSIIEPNNLRQTLKFFIKS